MSASREPALRSLSYRVRHAWLCAALMALAGPAGLLPRAFAAQPSPPELLTRVLSAFPDEPDMVGFLLTDDQMLDTLFDALPFGKTYRRVAEEQTKKFAEKTGFNPMHDVRAVAVAATRSGGKDDAPRILMLQDLARDPRKVAAVLEKDPKVKKHLKFTSKNKGVVKKVGFLLLEDGVFVASPGLIDAIAPKGGEVLGSLAREAAQAIEARPRALLAFKLPPLDSAKPPQGAAALLAQVRMLAMGMSREKLGIRATFASEEAAAAAAQMLNGLMNMTVAGLQQKATAAEKQARSLVGLLSPNLMGARASLSAARGLLETFSITPKGNVVSMKIDRASLPSLGSAGTTLMLGLGAAIASQSVRKAQGGSERSNRQISYSTQRVLASAIEMYELDTNEEVTQIDNDFLQMLVDEGYLLEMPTTPGQAPGSETTYYATKESSNGVACRLYGSADGKVKGRLSDEDEGSPPPAQGGGPWGALGQMLKGFTGQ